MMKGVLGILAPRFQRWYNLLVIEEGAGGMSDNFIDDTVRHGMKPGDLPTRPGHAHPYDANLLRQVLQLIDQLGVAGPGRGDGITMCPQIHRGQCLIIFYPEDDRLGRRGTHVQHQDTAITPFSNARGCGSEIDAVSRCLKGRKQEK
jgi:hypothetical protein